MIKVNIGTGTGELAPFDATLEFRHVNYNEAAAFNSDVVEVGIGTDTGELAPYVGRCC